MADFEGNKKQELVKKGTILLVQGEEPRYIHYLHSGSLEILSAPQELEGLNPDMLVSKSKRVGVIKEKSLISGLSILFTGPNKKSIRALEDSYVSQYPIREGGFELISTEDQSLALNILIHLCNRLEISISDASKYTKLYQNLCRINDNIGLVFKALSGKKLAEKLQGRAERLYQTYMAHGGDLPSQFDAKFLIVDNSSLLKKKYAFPGLPMEALVDNRQYLFIKKLLKQDPQKLLPIIRQDASLAVYMFEFLSESLMKVLDRVEAIRNEIDEELSLLFGPDASWSSYLIDGGGYDEWQNSDRLSPDFLKNLLSISMKISSFYEEISGETMDDACPGFKKIQGYYLSRKDRVGVVEQKPAERRGSRIVDKLYRNSTQQIFEFGLIDKELQKNYLKVMNEFTKMQNPFNTEPDGRKIRRYISRLFWDIYKQVFLRAQKESTLPPPVKLLLSFGYLDEKLMDDGQITDLHEHSTRRVENIRVPVYYEEEFLKKVMSGEENPSINEMGLSYEAFLREEGKHKKKDERGSGIVAEDENIQKTFYEIDHRLASTTAVCSGSTATAFPVLTSMVMKGNPANFFTSRKKVESIVNTLREIDFSVFYRETVVKLGEAREIIEEEVVPSFILLPCFGTKTMLWQELDGTNRKTRGRIVIPILFMGDLTRSLAHTFACFRWELNRTLKGAQWGDPVEGGLTGAYFDYINTFKKNPKLSVEAKERIAERFKSLRTNRDRFADDYISWVLYERDGIMKLNNVVRDMFYRHISFKKETRANLENMPAYSEIANRFKNVHSRELTACQRKFKKYMEPNGTLPAPLQKFMDFLES